MKLSIVIPVFNTEKYLSECLESIFSVKSDFFEVILIDDGSTDNSGKICDEYANKYSNIRVFHEKNNGVSTARNLGLKNAKGEYIMFVDSDDTLNPEWVEVVDSASGKDIYFIDERLDTGSESNIEKYIVGRNEKGIIISAPTSKLYRRKFLEENNIKFEKDIIHGEDMVFLLEIICKTNNVGVISKNIYNYRVYIGSSSRSFNEKIFKSDQLFHEKVSKLNIDEENKLFLIQNTIFVLSQKIALLDSFEKAKPYFERLEAPLYTEALEKKCLVRKKYKPFIYLFKKRRYKALYKTLRMANKLVKEG